MDAIEIKGQEQSKTLCIDEGFVIEKGAPSRSEVSQRLILNSSLGNEETHENSDLENSDDEKKDDGNGTVTMDAEEKINLNTTAEGDNGDQSL